MEEWQEIDEHYRKEAGIDKEEWQSMDEEQKEKALLIPGCKTFSFALVCLLILLAIWGILGLIFGGCIDLLSDLLAWIFQ